MDRQQEPPLAPPGFGMETAPAPVQNRGYRYACKQDNGRSVWVIDCPSCSSDDDGWMIRFDKVLGRMVPVEFRTKAAAERAIQCHEKGDHAPDIFGEIK